jgi:hypothetical protein
MARSPFRGVYPCQGRMESAAWKSECGYCMQTHQEIGVCPSRSLFVYKNLNILLQFLIDTFGLAIGLWMIGSEQ